MNPLSKSPAPNPQRAPREFLEHLYRVAVERAKIQTFFAVVPVADLGGMRRQTGMLVTEGVAGAHVGLGVLDGRAALGEPLGDVQPVGHDQAIRAAACSSASA